MMDLEVGWGQDPFVDVYLLMVYRNYYLGRFHGNSSLLMVFGRKDKDLSMANCGLLQGICRLNVSQNVSQDP